MEKINVVFDIEDKITKVRERQNFKRDVIDELPCEVALSNVSSPKVLKKLIEPNKETSEN